VVEDVEADVANGGDLAAVVAERLGQLADRDARVGRVQDLYLACAFRTNDMSAAFANGTCLSTASGIHTFMPFS
jgi:hypothetical protein